MAFSGWIDGAGDLFIVSPTRWGVEDQLSWMCWIFTYLFILGNLIKLEIN